MFQPEGSLQMARNRKCASYKSQFIDFSRHLCLGTSVLTNRSRHLDLSNILMNLCTREAAETWWQFLVIHEEGIPFFGNNDGKIVSSK